MVVYNVSSDKKDQRSLFEKLEKNLQEFVEDVFVPKKQKETDNKLQKFTFYVDGASRGNPGRSGAGVYLLQGENSIEEKGFFLGIRTNNEAEYFAMLLGIYFFKVHAQPSSTLTVISDSQLLIRQMQGIYKVKKPELQKLHMIATCELAGFAVEFQHVEREYNTIADALANKGVDEKIAVPLKFLDMLTTYGVCF